MDSNKIALKYGESWLKKSRKKRHKMLVTELCLDFAENTTLHGLRYTIQRGFSIIEKTFWLITFVISVVLCSILIRNLYIKWKYSPVIVTVNERLMSVGMVPFPSVTICPQIKSKATYYNYTAQRYRYEHTKQSASKMEGNETLSKDWLQKFEDISLICDHEKYTESKREFTNSSVVDHILEVFGPKAIFSAFFLNSLDKTDVSINVSDLPKTPESIFIGCDFKRVSPKIEDIFFYCQWRSKRVNCSVILKGVLTAEGVCYNMNGLAAEEIFRDNIQNTYKYINTSAPSRNWTMEDGYSDDMEPEKDPRKPNPYPRRGREHRVTPDLVVYSREFSKNLDELCNGFNSGHKIYIQHPADLPQSSIYYYPALPKQVTTIAVDLNVLFTDESLRHDPPSTRQCYFPEDRYLRYFRIYTANNCRMECLSNYTFRLCGCVGYYMPHDNSSRICTSKKMECIKSAQEIMADDEMKYYLDSKNQACRCLPACNNVDYDAEVVKADFNMKGYIRALYLTSSDGEIDLHNHEFTKLEIYFKRSQFIAMRRSELYGVTDFLANCGGLLGLFMGFSFLSLVEIFYYLTLRLGCILKRDLEEEDKYKQRKNKQIF